MKANYLCPHCRNFLNVDDKIILATENDKKENGILLLSIKLGNYSILKHPSFNLNEGDKIQISCPLCNTSLKKQTVHDNLYGIIMQDDEDKEMQILFSGVYGEKCTYKITDKEIESFGDDAPRYINLDNLTSIS